MSNKQRRKKGMSEKMDLSRACGFEVSGRVKVEAKRGKMATQKVVKSRMTKEKTGLRWY